MSLCLSDSGHEVPFHEIPQTRSMCKNFGNHLLSQSLSLQSESASQMLPCLMHDSAFSLQVIHSTKIPAKAVVLPAFQTWHAS